MALASCKSTRLESLLSTGTARESTNCPRKYYDPFFLVTFTSIRYKPNHSNPSDTFSASPESSRHEHPIRKWEDEPLHEVKLVSRLLLVLVEGLINDSAELELCQHQFVLPHEERTTSVALVRAGKRCGGRIVPDCEQIAE